MVPREGVGTRGGKDKDGNHLPTSRSTISGTRRNGQNYRIDQPTILLAEDARNHQTIRQKLRHMSTDQGGPACTLWPTTAKRSTLDTVEIHIHGFHHRLTQVRRTRCDIGSHRSADQNESLHTLSEGYQCKAICDSLPKRDIQTPRITSRYHYGSRKHIHIRYVEGNNDKIEHRTTPQHGLSPSNGWTDRKDQWNT